MKVVVEPDGNLSHLYKVGVFNYEPEMYEWKYFGHLSTHDYVYGVLKVKGPWTEYCEAVFVKFYQSGISEILDSIIREDGIDDEMLSNVKVGAGTCMEVLTEMDVFVVDHDIEELCYGDCHGVWMMSVDFKNGFCFLEPLLFLAV